MKGVLAVIGAFVLGVAASVLVMNVNKVAVPAMQAQTAGGAGNNAILLGKIAGQDALVVLDSSTKTILIYRLLSAQIEFWAARKFETDLGCESFGTTRPSFNEVKQKCKLEEKK